VHIERGWFPERMKDGNSDSLLREQIDGLGEWFHNLDLAGIPTAPNHFLGNYPRCKWEGFADSVPEDLSGRTVLDLGCNAGFYAFEMKRRGAERVVAVDSDPRYLAQARLASKVLDMDIELRQLSIYKIQRLKEKFDLVLFLGVLYHLRHPLLALDLIHEHAARDLRFSIDAAWQRRGFTGRRGLSNPRNRYICAIQFSGHVFH
jgi:tRNA (mo5U34)-methyltransferase